MQFSKKVYQINNPYIYGEEIIKVIINTSKRTVLGLLFFAFFLIYSLCFLCLTITDFNPIYYFQVLTRSPLCCCGIWSTITLQWPQQILRLNQIRIIYGYTNLRCDSIVLSILLSIYILLLDRTHYTITYDIYYPGICTRMRSKE